MVVSSHEEGGGGDWAGGGWWKESGEPVVVGGEARGFRMERGAWWRERWAGRPGTASGATSSEGQVWTQSLTDGPDEDPGSHWEGGSSGRATGNARGTQSGERLRCGLRTQAGEGGTVD